MKHHAVFLLLVFFGQICSKGGFKVLKQ